MCLRRDAWDTGAGPAGLDRALGDTECAMRVPPGATEWQADCALGATECAVCLPLAAVEWRP